MRTLSRNGILVLGFVVGAIFMLHCAGGGGGGGGRKARAANCAVDTCFDPVPSGLTGTDVQAVIDELAARLATLETTVAGLVLHDHTWIVPGTNVINTGTFTGTQTFNLSGLIPTASTAVVLKVTKFTSSQDTTFSSAGLSVATTGTFTDLLALPVTTSPSLTVTTTNTIDLRIDIVGYVEEWSP